MQALTSLPLEEFSHRDRLILQHHDQALDGTYRTALESLAAWELQEMIFDLAYRFLAFRHHDKVAINEPIGDRENRHELRSYTTAKLENLSCGSLCDLSDAGAVRLQIWLAQRYLELLN